MTTSRVRLLNRLRGAFIEEERQGLMLAAKVRSWSLLVVKSPNRNAECPAQSLGKAT